MATDLPDSVTLAYVHPNTVAHSWHSSLVHLLMADAGGHGRLMRGGFIAMRCGTDGLPGARNAVVSSFLDQHDAPWLWWIDTDMGFTPDTVERLVVTADPVERPVVGALCFAWREAAQDGMSGFRCVAAPTLYDWVSSDDGRSGFQGRAAYRPDALEQVAGTGSACILIHRSAFEKVRADSGDNWYTRMRNPSTGQLASEDLSFCARLAAAGIPVYVNTSVKTSHFKELWVGEQDFADGS